MKRIVGLVALLALAAGCEVNRSARSDAPKHLKVLMIGNSFSICVLNQLPQCAASAGCGLDLCSLYIGGCSLEHHWQNVLASTDDSVHPYLVTWNYGGKANDPAAPVARVAAQREKAPSKAYSANIPEMLTADRWDVVTLQQASHFSWRPETYEPYGGHLVDLIRRLAPQAKILVQETWSYTPYDKRISQWKLTPETMYAKIRPAYGAFAADYGLGLIPTGAAVQDFRRAMPSPDGITGDPCGSPTGPDKFHLNREGEYLQACTWFATLYGKPAKAIAYKPGFLTEERAAQMRKSADAAVGSR